MNFLVHSADKFSLFLHLALFRTPSEIMEVERLTISWMSYDNDTKMIFKKSLMAKVRFQKSEEVIAPLSPAPLLRGLCCYL